MKKSEKFLVVIFIIVIAGVALYYRISEPHKTINSSLLKTYKALEDGYSWDGKRLDGEWVQTSNQDPKSLIKEYVIPSKNIVIKSSREGYYCGNIKAEVKKYKSFSAGLNVLGGWGEESVVDCGDYYFINTFYDSGPGFYGPFDKDNKRY